MHYEVSRLGLHHCVRDGGSTYVAIFPIITLLIFKSFYLNIKREQDAKIKEIAIIFYILTPYSIRCESGTQTGATTKRINDINKR